RAVQHGPGADEHAPIKRRHLPQDIERGGGPERDLHTGQSTVDERPAERRAGRWILDDRDRNQPGRGQCGEYVAHAVASFCRAHGPGGSTISEKSRRSAAATVTIRLIPLITTRSASSSQYAASIGTGLALRIGASSAVKSRVAAGGASSATSGSRRWAMRL